MGRHEPDDAARKLRARLGEIQRALELRLGQRGLGRGQINEQDYENLKLSLGKLNQLLTDPLQLDDLTRDLDLGDFPDAPRQYLEDRKALILNRLQELSAREQLAGFEAIVAHQIHDPEQRDFLLTALKQERNQRKDDAIEVQAELNALRQKRTEEAVESQLRLAHGKNVIRQSWITREAVASLVGSFLLLILSITTIIAMFTGTKVIDIVANSFLLILGYFFGSSTSASLRKGDVQN